MLDANKHSETALEVTQRAYVNVESISLIQPFEVGKSAEAVVNYKNTGLTPAKDVDVSPMEDWIPNPLLQSPRPAAKHFLKCEIFTQGAVLPPGTTRQTSAALTMGIERARPITGKLYASIITNQTKWIVGAIIRYRDQFGHCHATAEPFWYNPASKEFDAAPYGFQQIDN
jgi:hypothetical protein